MKKEGANDFVHNFPYTITSERLLISAQYYVKLVFLLFFSSFFLRPQYSKVAHAGTCFQLCRVVFLNSHNYYNRHFLIETDTDKVEARTSGHPC